MTFGAHRGGGKLNLKSSPSAKEEPKIQCNLAFICTFAKIIYYTSKTLFLPILCLLSGCSAYPLILIRHMYLVIEKYAHCVEN